jgi:hypothetical protein
MTEPIAYTFAILRYIHDLAGGERVNVGVALFAPKARFVGALCSTNGERVARMFPGLNRDALSSALQSIQMRFRTLAARLPTEWSSPYEQKNVLDIARSVLPPDDSSLQWEASGSGLTDNPEYTLRRLFERMVQRYEPPSVSTDNINLMTVSFVNSSDSFQQLSAYFNANTSTTYGVLQSTALPPYTSGPLNNFQCVGPIVVGGNSDNFVSGSVTTQGSTLFGASSGPQALPNGLSSISSTVFGGTALGTNKSGETWYSNVSTNDASDRFDAYRLTKVEWGPDSFSATQPVLDKRA